MTINLSEEIKEVGKLLFEITKEHETCFYNLLSHNNTDISFAENKKDNNFYQYYPYLFQNEFNKVSKGEFRTIALSGWLYFCYLLVNDKLMDSKDLMDPPDSLYINLLLKKSYSLLYSIFNSSCVFWKYFAKYNKEFTNAVLLEQTKHVGIVSPYSYSEFKLIAKGKSSMSKFVTAALAILNDTPEKIKTLGKSQDYFHTALQLYDDLQDWKEDYLNRNYSYLLTNIIYDNQLTEQAASDNPPDLETIGRALFLSKAAENQMNKAVLLFKKAATYGVNCPLWIETIKKYQLQSEELRSKFYKIRKKLLSRRKIQQEKAEELTQETSESSQNKALQFSIKRALDYILTKRQINLLAMEYRKRYKKNKDFAGKVEKPLAYEYDVVYFRALLIDTLVDSRSFYPDADKIINKEVEILLDAQLKGIRGGWRYFEQEGLPPDSDDLGQVLQALVKSNYKKIDEAVSDPVSLLLSQCSYDDGSFETWIVDNNDTSTKAAIIKNAKGHIWSLQMGKDNEVLANILYGLYLYDFLHLKARIKKGVNCLEKRQSKEGCWNSTWAWGSYYGTYVAVRIIKAVKPGSSTLKKTENFLSNTQNYDGGWGNIGSDPLNTALALLSLVLLKSKNLKSFINGINYLYSKQNSKGYWNKVEFVKLESSHKSKTITTQFCLKALVAISKEAYLKDTIVPQQVNIAIPQTQIYPIYKDFVSFIDAPKKNNKREKHKLLNSLYINPNKDFFECLFKISSMNKDIISDSLILYKKDDILALMKQIERNDIINICKKSINRCFERLPMNEIPDIFLWIGTYAFPGENCIINGKPVIFISLEFFTDMCLDQKLKEQTYYNTRIREMGKSIPVIIANQYARLILKQMGVLKESFSLKLFEDGFAAYFSKETFPEHPLSSHLFFTSAELEWCLRNEWFLKREIKPYLQSEDDNIINRYFAVSENNNGKWFPDKTGCFTGYRIIEEYLNKTYTSTIRDLITESPVEVVAKSRFFNISN